MKKRLTLVTLLVALGLAGAGAQTLKGMEFRGQDLSDVLLALAQAGGVTAVPDETVRGTVSWWFPETGFENAWSLFLAAFRLYERNEGPVRSVSRIRAEWNEAAGTLSVDAEDVDVQLVFRAASRAMGRTILYDPLPRDAITIHAEALAPSRVLEIVAKRYPGYTVEAADDHFYIRKPATADARAPAARGELFARSSEGLWTIDKESARFGDLLDELFRREGLEYSLLMRADATLERLRFRDKGFDEMLRLVLELANADVAVREGVRYVFEIQRKDVLKKLKTAEVIPLRFVAAQDLSGLVPPELSAGGFFRVDKASNSVILSGSAEELAPIREFVARLDRPVEGKGYYRFRPAALKAKELLAMLPAWLAASGPVLAPDGESFILALTPEQKLEADAFVAAVDRGNPSVPIRLRYIKVEELIKALPPSVAKEDLKESGDASTVFFVGKPERLEALMRELEVIDRPKPQIRYDILVVQYERSDSAIWKKELAARSEELGGGLVDFEDGAVDLADAFSVVGSLGSLVSLNFDIVSALGFLSSVKLSLEIGELDARVFADTTLTALSGNEVKFQNTSTYRYRDSEIDPDTGDPKYTGVTRELTSGLIVTLNGWVSGDGMITMDIQTTVSKRGADSSSSGTNPPTTTERVVSSRLRTASGVPVVLSGLVQRELSENSKKIPLLGDIPLIGFLFRDIDYVETENELVIYIVPRVLEPSDDEPGGAGLRMERLWRELVEGRVIDSVEARVEGSGE